MASKGPMLDKSGAQENRQKLIQDILAYLIDHPEAKDTAEGVMQWWVVKGDAEYQQEEVEEALDGLVTRGWLTKRSPLPSLYGLNKERVAEIQRFLLKNFRE